jgi:beta-1,2-mannobiose phosphorylase / 1,2-beta-oligomannan phosphorylase
MKTPYIYSDKIVLSPVDIDLKKCPVHVKTGLETTLLGAFNPGMTRLANGNLLLMVRIAESIKEPIKEGKFHYIRWTPDKKYVVEEHPTYQLDTRDPRKFRFLEYDHIKVFGLTSFSWLLPVELSPDGLTVLAIHYDKIIEPTEPYQEYGIEDPRITKIGLDYYMTTCSVSSERHSTTLYHSADGLNYTLRGIIMDHQNKDMILFPERINGKYYAMTRPLGDLYFTTGADAEALPGPSINLSVSPDLFHWKPVENTFIRARKNSLISYKLGGGAPPVLTEKGWLCLFHGVEKNGPVGRYRTFMALLDPRNPEKILTLNDRTPVLEANPALTSHLSEWIYLKDVVFTTGIDAWEDRFIIASGELDLACRMTHLDRHFYKTMDE